MPGSSEITRKHQKPKNAKNPSRCVYKRKKKRTPKNYFKFPIGVTSGTVQFNFQPSESMCACLVAYGFSFIKPEHSWTPEFINEMLLAVADHDLTIDVDFHGDPSSQTNSFLLENYSVDVWMSDVTAEAQEDNLLEDLRRNFTTRKAILVLPEGECIAIWTHEDHFAYFLFIPSKKSLFLMATLKDLATFLRFLCDSEALYKIFEMQITKLAEESPQVETPKKYPGRGYVVVDEDLAILRGTLQLKAPRSLGDIQGLYAGYTATIFAHTTPLNSWDSETLDRVLMISESLTKKSLNAGKIKFSYFISCGTYRVHMDTEIAYYENLAEVLEDIRRLEKALNRGWSMILEFNGIFWTIMLQNIFYLYNPYENSRKTSLGSSLQMHKTLGDILGILNYAVEEGVKATVHLIKIISLVEAAPTTPDTQTNLHNLDEESEEDSPQEARESLEVWSEDIKENYPKTHQEEEKSVNEELQQIYKEAQEEIHVEEELIAEMEQNEREAEKLFMEEKQKRIKLEEEEVVEMRQMEEKERNMKKLANDIRKKRKEMEMKLRRVKDRGDYQESSSISDNPSTIILSSSSSSYPPRNTPSFSVHKENSDTVSFNLSRSIPSFYFDKLESPKTASSQMSDTPGMMEIPDETKLNDNEEIANTGKTFEIQDKQPVIENIPISRDTSPDRDDLIVLQSNTGSQVSISKLIRKGLSLSSRLLITTPGKRFLVFHRAQELFLYTGCICSIRQFPKEITDKFICFTSIHNLILHILKANKSC